MLREKTDGSDYLRHQDFEPETLKWMLQTKPGLEITNLIDQGVISAELGIHCLLKQATKKCEVCMKPLHDKRCPIIVIEMKPLE